MKLWMSGEISDEAENAVTIGSKIIEPLVNKLINSVEIKEDYEKWAFLSIIMPPEWIADYPEVVRRSLKNKVLEFRLHIDHATFKEADQQGQIQLVLAALERSVDLMEKLKVSTDTRIKLKEILSQARQELLV